MVAINILNMLLVEFDFTDEERKKERKKRHHKKTQIFNNYDQKKKKIQVELLSSLECSRIYEGN